MKLLAIAVLSLALTGCATNNEESGALIGAVVGGIVGNQVGSGSGRALATGIGVIAGAMIGGNIGRRMDEQDRAKVNRTLETTPTGRTTSWVNPDSGNRYAVTPTRTYEQRGTPCREYTTTAIIGGKKEEVYGTACRQADGSWKAQ